MGVEGVEDASLPKLVGPWRLMAEVTLLGREVATPQLPIAKLLSSTGELLRDAGSRSARQRRESQTDGRLPWHDGSCTE